MNSTCSRWIACSVGLVVFLCAYTGRSVGFCIPNAQNNYCQPPPPPPDTTPPTISIQPQKGLNALKVPSVVLTGTASDAGGVASVKFRVENYYGNTDYQSAGITPWTANVTGLAGGQNFIRIQAVDSSGNTNEVVQPVFYIQKVPLVLNTTGEGKTMPNFASKTLQVGEFYTMTAEPANGFAFANWSGDQAGNSATLEFLMLTNTVLQANFVPTPFADVAGNYEGVITSLVSGRPELGGTLTAKVAKTGKFTARILLGSKRYSLLGVISADGSYRGSIKRKGLSPVNVELQLDINGQVLHGSFTDLSVSSDPTGDVSAMIQMGANH